MDLLYVFPNGPSSVVPHIIVSDLEGMLYSTFALYIADFMPVLEMSEGLGNPLFSHHKKLRESVHFVDTP